MPSPTEYLGNPGTLKKNAKCEICRLEYRSVAFEYRLHITEFISS